jgi:prophage tail gpP-like protein
VNVGTDDEEVKLVIKGEEITGIYQRYSINVDVFTQPANFSITVGDGSVVSELLTRYQRGDEFELYIGGTRVCKGRIDGRRAHGRPSVVTFFGRDPLAPLFDNTVLAERAFQNETYFELTSSVLDEVGLQDALLLTSNEQARKKFSDVNINESKPPRLSTEHEVIQPTVSVFRGVVNAAAATSQDAVQSFQVVRQMIEQGRTVRHIVSAETGTVWWSFLQEQYKKVGLFLWATPDGDFVLSEPNANQEPAYRLLRRRGEDRNAVNVIDANFTDGSAEAHSIVVCYGKTGRGKNGRLTCRGEFQDQWLLAKNIRSTLAFEDEGVTSDAEAEYVARRRIAEERRRDWSLSYTVAGHRVMASQGRSRAIWCPDTVVDVQDDEYGLQDTYYLHGVTYERSPHTTTTLHLMRKEDLVFAENAT